MRRSIWSKQASEKECKLSDPTSEVIFCAYPQSLVAEILVIERSAEDVGNVCVHFPRSGYRIHWWETIRYQRAEDVKRKPSDGKGG